MKKMNRCKVVDARIAAAEAQELAELRERKRKHRNRILVSFRELCVRVSAGFAVL